MSSLPVTRRWPRRGALIAGAVVLAILVAATIDYRHTAGALPEVGVFTVDHPASSDPAVAERIDLRDGFVQRAWLYSLGLVAAVAALVLAGVRATPRGRRRDLFTDLGVAGVCAFGLALAIAISGPDLLDEATEAPIWLPPVLMLVAAGAGSLLTSRVDVVEEPRLAEGATRMATAPPGSGGALEPVASRIGWLAAGLSALAVVLLVIGASGGVDCGEPTPAWRGGVLLTALGVSLIVGLCGIVALFVRQWVVALLSIPFPAAIALFAFAAAGGGCLS